MNIKYFKKGIRDACGIPLIGLALSMFTFGAYLKTSNFSILQTFLSTFFAFALPGQFVMAETLISGGNLINVFLAVLLTNARLFPMTIHIIPTLKSTKISGWKYYVICHFIAVTAWINYIAIYKRININYRYYYFFGLGGTLWLGSVISTVLGFLFSFIRERLFSCAASRAQKIVFVIWLILVIAWNFGYPEASPLEDVFVAVVLAIFNVFLRKLLKL